MIHSSRSSRKCSRKLLSVGSFIRMAFSKRNQFIHNSLLTRAINLLHKFHRGKLRSPVLTNSMLTIKLSLKLKIGLLQPSFDRMWYALQVTPKKVHSQSKALDTKIAVNHKNRKSLRTLDLYCAMHLIERFPPKIQTGIVQMKLNSVAKLACLRTKTQCWKY